MSNNTRQYSCSARPRRHFKRRRRSDRWTSSYSTVDHHHQRFCSDFICKKSPASHATKLRPLQPGSLWLHDRSHDHSPVHHCRLHTGRLILRGENLRGFSGGSPSQSFRHINLLSCSLCHYREIFVRNLAGETSIVIQENSSSSTGNYLGGVYNCGFDSLCLV